MKYLNFLHSDKHLTLIGEFEESQIPSAISQYVHSVNPRFTIYYVRVWKDQNGVEWRDVGSHSEFFLVSDKKLDRRKKYGI